jgi:hypothetical protein
MDRQLAGASVANEYANATETKASLIPDDEVLGGAADRGVEGR